MSSGKATSQAREVVRCRKFGSCSGCSASEKVAGFCTQREHKISQAVEMLWCDQNLKDSGHTKAVGCSEASYLLMIFQILSRLIRGPSAFHFMISSQVIHIGKPQPQYKTFDISTFGSQVPHKNPST